MKVHREILKSVIQGNSAILCVLDWLGTVFTAFGDNWFYLVLVVVKHFFVLSAVNSVRHLCLRCVFESHELKLINQQLLVCCQDRDERVLL